MTTATGEASRASLSLAVPANWLKVSAPQDQAATDRLADALVARYQHAGYPPPLLRTLVQQSAYARAELGVVAAYVCLADQNGAPLLATLLVSTRPMRDYSIEEIAKELATRHEHIRRQAASVVRLPTGSAVRAEWLRDWPRPMGGRRPWSLTVQYVIPAPDGQVAVTLTFSTPAADAAGRLRPLFDQIAQTVEFQNPGQ